MVDQTLELAGRFTWVDWCVVLALILFTTWVGHRMSGKQASIRDFFLGGRKLPWFAVGASIVATEISAVTFISLPSVVWRPGGNFTYLQLGLIGSLLARGIVGYVLVPAYYEREIYSPYDYMAARLGARTRSMATVIFSLGGILGQAARVYVTAVVIQVILQRELAWVELHWNIPSLVSAVAAIGIVSVIWTLIGGIATVIWTDAILFVLFLIGIVIAITTAAMHIDGGLMTVFREGASADKFELFNFSTDPTQSFTFWVALIAMTWSGIGSYGTDQLIAQRMFCCKSAREARLAILSSYAAMGVTLLVGLVGVALFAYYQRHAPSAAGIDLVVAKPDRIFPVFITEVIPTGLKGLVLAGAFAAAISSLDSIMAALSQTTISGLYLPWRKRGGADPDSPDEQRRTLRASRILVVFWAVLLCAVAVACEEVEKSYDSILTLALGVVGYTGGALIAGFALAFSRLRIDGSGYLYSAPLSILTILAISSHQPWGAVLRADGGFPAPETLCLCAGALLLALWLALRVVPVCRRGGASSGLLAQTLLLIAALAGAVLLAYYGFFGEEPARASLAWAWWMPVGSLVAFTFGVLLARPRAGALES